ncbi:MAG: hypothetical protein ABIQ86_06175 [Steroidobacteraceae bacterium]
MLARDNKVPFRAHVALLQFFVIHRTAVVERIRGVLSAQQKPLQFQQDRALLGLKFEDCFFAQPGIPPEQSALRGQLQGAHWADGFKPRDMPGIPNEMFDPADMVARAFTVWRHTGWPGRNGRLRYAHTLFNLHVVRCVTLLVMRLCDAGAADASERLALLQEVLNVLWKSSPADQPVLVRDVRWLVPVAQSPTTDDLAPYFEATRKIEECLPEADCLEIHKASVLMAGGHLRSQLRYFTMNGRSLDEKSLTLSTRASNALDCAMTIQHLVPLLAAYEQAIGDADADRRRVLAGVICQGISADPELYLKQLDLLGAYSMIEPLFVTTDGDRVAHTPMGQRHVQLVQEYVARVERLTQPLQEDFPQFRPVSGTYSPYGVMYGFSSNILEHMALKTLQPDAEARFSLEDVFADAGHGAQRLAWVSGWRRLPHVPPEVLKLYKYPQLFAEEIFARIEQALRSQTCEASTPVRTGRLFIDAAGIAELPVEHVLSSDPQIVAAGKAQPCEPERLRGDRQEGMYLVSYQTPGGWVAISKNVLTDVLGTGLDVNIAGLPDRAAQALGLMYPRLVAR